MPNYDRTGPNGRGAMSGRGLGPCGRGQTGGGLRNGSAGRGGAGRGIGRRAWNNINENSGNMLDRENNILLETINELSLKLSAVEDRLSNIEKGS